PRQVRNRQIERQTMASTRKAEAAKAVRSVKMLIDGDWVAAKDGRELPVESPGSREIIAHIPRGGAVEVDAAVRAAAKAFPSWMKVPPRDRGRMLQKIADAL